MTCTRCSGNHHGPGIEWLHVALDHAVAEAYGWGDLPLEHGYHPTTQGERFTISEAAQAAVLDRLLELNHARYAEEVASGLHERVAPTLSAAQPSWRPPQPRPTGAAPG